MITPEQFAALPDSFVALIQDAEDSVIRDISRRLSKEGFFTKTAIEQTRSLALYYGQTEEEITERVAAFLGKSEADMAHMYESAMDQLIQDEGYVFERLGAPQSLSGGALRQNIIEAVMAQTRGDLRNITNSMGFMVGGRLTPVAQAYQSALDLAVMQAQTGGITAERAIKEAVVKLSDSGIRTVDYASGRVEHVDVAVRRSVITGIHQLSGQVAETQARDLGTGLFEVSAHAGARSDGIGFENHKAWQGKVYWYKTPVEGYESLVAATGYGEALGLEGINCRHSKHPFVEGVSIRAYTDKELAEIDPKPFVFEGRVYNAYEATQMQRKIERTMRMYKRRIVGLEAAGFGKGDPTYDQARSLLQAWSRKYTEFSSAAGLRKQPERARVAGFKR